MSGPGAKKFDMLNLLQANNLSLRDLLPAALMDELRQEGRRVTYPDRRLIQQRGDRRPTFSIVDSGQVLAGNVGADGTFVMTSLMNPGDHFGEFTLFAGLPRTQNLWAIGETTICHINGRAFQAIFDREPRLPRALLTVTLRRLHSLVEFMDGQRRWPLPVRIAHLLMTSVPGDATPTRHEVRCRQEDLAHMLGVSRVAVGKALKALQSEALVLMGYGSIVLPDIRRLSLWIERYRQVTPITPSNVWGSTAD